MLNKIISTLLCISLLLFSCIFACNTLDSKKINKINTEEVEKYYQNIGDNKDYESNYIGVLDIPSIRLTRGFYDKSSPLNDVNMNIYYVKESIPLEESGSMIILAAHRGNSNVSFFDDLDKLNIGSTINLWYKDKFYSYILNNKYDEVKDGKLNIYRDNRRDSLILISCNKLRRRYQTIYVSYRKEDV